MKDLPYLQIDSLMLFKVTIKVQMLMILMLPILTISIYLDILNKKTNTFTMTSECLNLLLWPVEWIKGTLSE